MSDMLLACLFGVLLGMRHAVEPDHLAAVTTLNLRASSPWRGALLGAYWGLGHALALLALGGALVLMQTQLPPRHAALLEGGVGLMLMGLGIASLRRAMCDGKSGPVQRHSHSGQPHEHATLGAHLHVGPWTLLKQPLLIGFAHGLAGSGALTAVAFSSLPTVGARLFYIAMFGAGATLGMAALSGVLGVPLSQTARRPRLHRGLSLCAGSFSLLLGVYWTAAAWGLLEARL